MSILTITDKAKEKIISLCEQHNKKFIKVGVNSGGCSGFSYDIGFADTVEDGDEVITLNDNISVVVDNLSIMYLVGTILEWNEDLMGSSFNFSNPNAKSSCGCGESFGI